MIAFFSGTGFLQIGSRDHWYAIVPMPGTFSFQFGRTLGAADIHENYDTLNFYRPAALGFAYRSVEETNYLGRPQSFSVVRCFEVPYWFFVIVTVPFPLYVADRKRREKLMRTRGDCRACGYDLRESPTVCPECGRAVTAVREDSWRLWTVDWRSTVWTILVLLAVITLLCHPFLISKRVE